MDEEEETPTSRRRSRRVSQITPKSEPQSPSKRKRGTPNHSAKRKQQRGINLSSTNRQGTTEGSTGGDNESLRQEGSFSSSVISSVSDDEDLPPLMLSTPSESGTFSKHEIVWIKYKKVYWPSLITNVHKKHVNFKFINGSRKYSYRCPKTKIIKFDDPERNMKLLNEGKQYDGHIKDAYDRVMVFRCRLTEQEDLSPLKFLFFDKIGDLLYGIIPEIEGSEDVIDESVERVIEDDVEYSEDSASDTNDERNCSRGDDDEQDCSRANDDERNCSQINELDLNEKKLSDEEKTKLKEKLKVLHLIIESEDCFQYLENIFKGNVPSARMNLLKQGSELELQFQSGYGPFTYGETSETDQLLEVLNTLTDKLKYTGDSSLLLRHVLLPEAIMFALRKQFNFTKEKAEEFFLSCNYGVPSWEES